MVDGMQYGFYMNLWDPENENEAVRGLYGFVLGYFGIWESKRG
jgi:hypothetical protein